MVFVRFGAKRKIWGQYGTPEIPVATCLEIVAAMIIAATIILGAYTCSVLSRLGVLETYGDPRGLFKILILKISASLSWNTRGDASPRLLRCSQARRRTFTMLWCYDVQLTPGSPAARIGLRSGDEIVEIELTPTTSLTYQQALDLVNSHADTLLMTVERYPRLPLSQFYYRK